MNTFEVKLGVWCELITTLELRSDYDSLSEVIPYFITSEKDLIVLDYAKDTFIHGEEIIKEFTRYNGVVTVEFAASLFNWVQPNHKHHIGAVNTGAEAGMLKGVHMCAHRNGVNLFLSLVPYVINVAEVNKHFASVATIHAKNIGHNQIWPHMEKLIDLMQSCLESGVMYMDTESAGIQDTVIVNKAKLSYQNIIFN